jgi:hypothetical protein
VVLVVLVDIILLVQQVDLAHPVMQQVVVQGERLAVDMEMAVLVGRSMLLVLLEFNGIILPAVAVELVVLPAARVLLEQQDLQEHPVAAQVVLVDQEVLVVQVKDPVVLEEQAAQVAQQDQEEMQ